jgi:hypothetical protein
MRRLLLLLVMLGPLMLISCNDDNGDPADTTNPEVAILQPQDGGSVPAADVLVRAQATDNQGIAKVEYYVDGAKVGEDETGTANVYEYTWGAGSLTLGSSHIIRARAIDTSGNDGEATITVTITAPGGTIHSEEIITNETWDPSGNPHIVTGAIGVTGGATLTILPGCIVQFEPDADAGISVGWQPTTGAVVAVGTALHPIVFTSRAAVPQRGDWRGLSFYGGMFETTHLSYCTIEYTGYDDAPAVYVAWGAALRMDHCIIRHAGGHGISYEHEGHVEQFNNNTITTCADFPLETEPEYVRHLGTGNSFTGNDPGKDRIMVYDGGIGTSGTWRNQGVPFEVSVINEGGGIWITPTDGTSPILTIEAGTTIRFGVGAQVLIGYGGGSGGLIAVGTALLPITFTSASDAPQPGDWGQINFSDGAVDGQCHLENCIIEYGGRGTYGNIMVVDALPTISHCTIRHGSSYGIYLAGGEYPDAGSLETNNTFSNLTGQNVYAEP